jgi:hypothetical protein
MRDTVFPICHCPPSFTYIFFPPDAYSANFKPNSTNNSGLQKNVQQITHSTCGQSYNKLILSHLIVALLLSLSLTHEGLQLSRLLMIANLHSFFGRIPEKMNKFLLCFCCEKHQ